jgi:hypothetical protein
MNPEDDPEARIRELERPLGDAAKATELGAGQFGTGYPPPTAPIPPQGWYGSGGYQPPFPAPPAPQPSGGSRVWLIVAAVAVVLIAAVAGIVVYTANVFTSSFPFPSAPASPTRASGGGGFDTIPSVPGRIGTEPAPSVEPPAAGGQLSVSGIGETKTLECNETEVSISGVSNNVTLTGHCASVEVSGVSNVITVDSAGAINASGIQNRITFHTGQPAVDNSGSQNVVEQG